MKSDRCCICLFIRRFYCVCVGCTLCLRICIHLELWMLYIREQANSYMNSMFGNFLSWSLYKVVCSLPDGLLPVNLGVPVALPSSLPFPPLFEFRYGDPVGEGDRSPSHPFPLPFLFGSCLIAHASTDEHCGLSWSNECSLLFRSCVLACYLLLPLQVLVSMSRIEMRIFDFLLEVSSDHQRQSAIIILLVAECRSWA